jgi:hypothetical protein
MVADFLCSAWGRGSEASAGWEFAVAIDPGYSIHYTVSYILRGATPLPLAPPPPRLGCCAGGVVSNNQQG